MILYANTPVVYMTQNVHAKLETERLTHVSQRASKLRKKKANTCESESK